MALKTSGRVASKTASSWSPVQLPAAEAATGSETTGSIGQILRQPAQIIEAHEPGVSSCRGEIADLAGDASECAEVRGSIRVFRKDRQLSSVIVS